MTDPEQKQSTAETADSFARLWQEKWAEMLKQQGWSDSMNLPGFGVMPFTLPFMTPFGSDNSVLLARIAELENRLAKVEKAMTQRTTTGRKNAPPKG